MPIVSLASGSNHFAAAINANPPRNQLIVLKCNNSGTSLLMETPIRPSAIANSSNGLTISR
jgi:hypothetical protein